MKMAARFLSIALLLVTGALGLYNGSTELGQGATGLQRSVTVAVILYGVLGCAGGIGLLRRRPWSVVVSVAWTIAATYAATVASFAFSDPAFTQPGTTAGVAGAFVSIALIGAFVIWTARSATRVPQPTERSHIPPS